MIKSLLKNYINEQKCNHLSSLHSFADTTSDISKQIEIVERQRSNFKSNETYANISMWNYSRSCCISWLGSRLLKISYTRPGR